MNRNGLILLQAVGALSILAYPAVLIANIMAIAAPGRHSTNWLPYVLLSLYPLVWIGLYVFAWRAMARGAVGLAFGLSSIPALACLLVIGVYVFSWIGFGLGMMGIGKGGLHVHTYPKSNPLLDSISLDGGDVLPPPGPGTEVEQALHDIDANSALVNAGTASQGSILNVALGYLSISLDGSINGDLQRQQDRIRVVRALVAHGARLNFEEATDLSRTWLLRRALYDGPVTTAAENPLVWRIVNYPSDGAQRCQPLTEKLPLKPNVRAPFALKEDEIPLLRRSTPLHGTPLYAALLTDARDICQVIIKAGGRLSPEEEHDAAAAAALERVFYRDGSLRLAYSNPNSPPNVSHSR